MSMTNIESMKQNGAVLWWKGDVSSANAPKSITSYGDCKQILPFPGAGIAMFDGNGDYITVPDSDDWYFGTGDFTIEFMFYTSDVTTTRTIFVHATDGNNMHRCCYASGILYWQNYHTSTYQWNFGNAISINTWYRVQLIRSGSTQKMYFNGVLQSNSGTSSAAVNNYANVFCIGYNNVDGIDPFIGYISEFRISSVIRPISTSNGQLQSDANTKLLLHFNSTGTTFTDSSPSNHTITAYGDAKQLCSPCGSGVAKFASATSDYLTAGTTGQFDYGNGPFTLETNIYLPNGGSGIYELFCLPNNDTNGYHPIHICVDGSTGAIAFLVWSTGTEWVNVSNYLFTANATLGAWNHIAFERTTDGYLKGYLNGVERYSYNIGTTSLGAATAPLRIGGNYRTGTPNYLNGYLSEPRVSNTARYTTTFTPSAQPFRPDPYTKLLLHFDGVGNAFYDSSDPPGDNGFPILPAGVTVTPTGTFTTQKMKDGRNIWKFDGSTNYVSLSDHDAWNFGSGNFTISYWFKLSAITNEAYINQGINNTNRITIAYYSTFWYFVCFSGGSSLSEYRYTYTPSLNTWIHITFIRDNNSTPKGKLYLNGNLVTITETTAFVTLPDLSSPFEIGHLYDGAGNYYINGNIKDLMIFKGKALTSDMIAAIYKETFIY